jgi:MoaA/NifB/PqqE/SkfB family radical SAM enzyme
LSIAGYIASFPPEGLFEVQLEGGEPTIHPAFWHFVQIARENPRCTRLVLCTNGVVLPRSIPELRTYVSRLGVPLTIKLSINHHLLDHDPALIRLALDLRDVVNELKGGGLLVLNVRLRRGYANNDRHVRQLVEDSGLLPHANIFYLQRYGFASDEADWELPSPVWEKFSLVNPDGGIHGPDLIARSEAMRRLP